MLMILVTCTIVLLSEAAVPGGGRSSTETFTIHVIEQNNNAPFFAYPIYRVTIMENDAKYNVTPVIIVKAWDQDMGPNGEITYSLRSFSEAWLASNLTINSTTGAIYLKSPVDFELLQNKSGGYGEVSAEVAATDQGVPPLTTSVPLTIVIQDEIETPQASSMTSI